MKVVTRASVEVCSLAAGEVVGHKNILAASRMNSSVILFLNTVERATELTIEGIVIRGELTSVLPLSTPSKRVTLSNVPPFIKDETLERELSRFGKVISPIKKIGMGTSSELLQHVVSFRRFTYMVLNSCNTELERTLTFKIEGFDYTIYVSTQSMKCFSCGKPGHFVR
ncbi:MAG: hypothetical protein ACRC6N_00005, partial [Plesiomonas sp.]|uniref:hypothetical protein n=1 Tax=Plesiomonas sp. TaxID=2486279 RepID=UPI003F3E7B02